jgi:Curli production assembly/transport component CsgG
MKQSLVHTLKIYTFVVIVASLGASGYAQETSSAVEQCSRKLGSLAVSEPSGASSLSGYGLGSPTTLLRMMVQKSNCFDVVERGQAYADLQRERALAGSGELQGGSNVGKGQLQAADFVMTPGVQFNAGTGGANASVTDWGRGLLGKLGGLGSVVGGLAGNVKFKEAQTNLLLSDVRSGIQVASAEGKAEKTDFGISGWGYGSSGYGSMGGYTNTPEGKMIAASLLDNYNNIVRQIRDQNSLVRNSTASSQQNAANSIRATTTGAPATNIIAASPGVVSIVPGTSGTSNNSAMANYQGVYRGTFEGNDRGTFIVLIDGGGQVTGTCVSGSAGTLSVQGRYMPSANKLDMTTSGNAAGGTATYSGVIAPNTGTLTGVWMAAQGGGSMQSGTFKGQRE